MQTTLSDVPVMHKANNPPNTSYGAQFGGEISLNNRTIRYHTEEIPYNGDMCSAQFGQTGDLKRYIHAHAIEKLSVTHVVPSLLRVVP